MIQTFRVPKETGTYADVLKAFGLARLLREVVRRQSTGMEAPEVRLVDEGSAYRIEIRPGIDPEKEVPFFASPAPFLVSRQTPEAPPGAPIRDVDETWDRVRRYGELRKALWDKGLRGNELEAQLRDAEPPGDWTLVAFLGDRGMQAIKGYNRIVAQWAKAPQLMASHLSYLVQKFGRGRDPEEDGKIWAKAARSAGLLVDVTAAQLLNPSEGKGLNEPKGNALRMGNVKRTWLEEYLKAVGLWTCLIPRKAEDGGPRKTDWKAYVLAPLNLRWGEIEQALRGFRRYLWKERRSDATSLKLDITSLLLFLKAWFDYVEAAHNDGLLLEFEEAIPEKVVAGFHVVQFKPLSQQAYTMVNQSFLNLPRWTGTLRDQGDVKELKEVIDEHLNVIRGIPEGHSDGFDLLRRYREFAAGGNWDAFFDFAVGYSHEILRRYAAGDRFVPLFSTQGIRRLLMASKKELLPIVEDEGFQRVAYAIRHSTVIPQRRKAQNKEYLYEIRYGLGAELKRKATNRDEFVIALMDFVHRYNQENAQVLERTKQQYRKNVRTSDVEAVVRLVDAYGPEVVANLLVAYGYASEPREETEEASVAATAEEV